MAQPKKATVHYTDAVNIIVGGRATLKPVDHTSPLVSNTKWATTSTILSVEPNGTTFETLNSIYVKKDDHHA